MDEHLYEIRAVHQTLRHDETNAYLALGWRLLKILCKDDEGEYVGFLLGWPDSAPPQRPSYDKEARRFFIRDSEPRNYFTEDDQSA
ncbi:MAG: hypothetical protein WCO60_07105 [Verrucomicrobiota bacterium]